MALAAGAVAEGGDADGDWRAAEGLAAEADVPMHEVVAEARKYAREAER